MTFFLILLGFLALSFGATAFYFYKKANEQVHLNELTKKENQKINQINSDLREEQKTLKERINNEKEQLNLLQSNISNSKQLSTEAFEQFCEVLDKNYEEKEKEYNQLVQNLSNAYATHQEDILEKIAQEKAELEKIHATRTAAIEAHLREKKLEEDLSFYCLHAKDTELTDIGILESIKPKLNNPRILSMLIWQTYWQKPMNALCAQVIGTTTKCGIYKITNVKTKECYIGQAVDIATRWKQHAKCGLGIDTPPANKLYKAIQEYGIWNFSWEVLENCSSKELDEKEKYFIELYKSKDYGYNGNKGNSN